MIWRVSAIETWALLSKSFQAADGSFVGLANFTTYFANPALANSIWNSVWISLVSTVIFGLYLYFALNHSKLKLHANGAFASLRIADFKNFLRICVTADGIQVFPIGIRKVPEDWDLEIPSRQEAGKGEKDEGQQRSLFYPKPGKFASRTTPSSWYERLTKSTPLSEPFLIEGPVCIKKNT